ncbi:MAG: dienelactone hydrolase family protein [Chitinophagaceae bacterium]
MASILKRFSAIFLMGVLLTSCKKDMKPTADPNSLVETQPAIQKPITVKVNGAIGGYYSALPVHYNETTKSYPLLIFIPGSGQFGNGALDLPAILNDGVAQILDEKKFPPNFTVNGKNFSMIVLTPQFSHYPANDEIASFIEYARKNYRIDATRIYISGLSMGGFVTSAFASEYASLVAAAVPISGVLTSGDLTARCLRIAQGKLAVWVFHNTEDPTINSSDSMDFVSMINNDHPSIPAKLTLFKASVHDAWTKAIDPAFKENKMNIYEWMLQYSK